MPKQIYQPGTGEFYIYVYWNPLKDNQPFYVGKGKNRRAFDHLGKLDIHTHKYRTIQNIKKAGLLPKITCAWHGADETYAFRVEKLLIAMWRRRCDGGLLTNLVMGGEGPTGRIVSDETRKKLSAVNKGTKRSEAIRTKLSAILRKCVHTPESRKRQADKIRGRPISEERKCKQSEAMKGRTPWNKGMKARNKGVKLPPSKLKGRRLSKEIRLKMSESAKRREAAKRALRSAGDAMA